MEEIERARSATSAVPARRWSAGCSRAASTVASSPAPVRRGDRADRRGRSAWSACASTAGAVLRGRRTRRRGAGHRGLRMGPRARAQLHPRPDDPSGLGADQHRRRAPAWRCGSARRSATCARRGGCPPSTCPIEGCGTVAWQVNGERTSPHCIMVNRRGRRFTNEAANYNAFGAAFHVVDVSTFEYVNHPAGWSSTTTTSTSTARPATAAGQPTPGLDRRGADAWPSWPTPSACHRRRARGHGGPLERPGRGRRRPRLRPRPQRPRPLVGRPRLRLPMPATLGPIDIAAVLRRRGPQRRARHEGRPPHRRSTPRSSTSTATRSPGCTPPAT